MHFLYWAWNFWKNLFRPLEMFFLTRCTSFIVTVSASFFFNSVCKSLIGFLHISYTPRLFKQLLYFCLFRVGTSLTLVVMVFFTLNHIIITYSFDLRFNALPTFHLTRQYFAKAIFKTVKNIGFSFSLLFVHRIIILQVISKLPRNYIGANLSATLLA